MKKGNSCKKYISAEEEINKKILRLSFVFTGTMDPFDQLTSFPFDSYLQHKLKGKNVQIKHKLE